MPLFSAGNSSKRRKTNNNTQHDNGSDTDDNISSSAAVSPLRQTVADKKQKNEVDPESTQTKEDYVKTATSAIGEREKEGGDNVEDNDPELEDIPWQVRRMVSFTDDPTLPTITFRYFLLTVLFIVPGAFLSQLSQYRTTYAPYSVFFVQITCHYIGLWLAKILPTKVWHIPFTRYTFSMNPGPWSIKEHVLVTLSAASGATNNLGATPISLAELYYGRTIHPAAAIFFMWAIVWTGYSFAAIARQFLLYEPQYPWFQALMQTALFETQRKNHETQSRLARRQMIIFFLVLLGVTLWQFLPEFVFPMLSSMAFLCYFAPRNATANFISSGLGGMGFFNLSFDWSNISNYNSGVSLFLSPWWTQVVLFCAFVLNCWILIPAAKWGGMGSFDYGLMSNRLFTAEGKRYPAASLVDAHGGLNETAYAAAGPAYVGTQQLWSMFFDYASYVSAFVWIALFGSGQIAASWKKLQARIKHTSTTGEGSGINYQYTDKLNVLMRSYEEVPFWWYFALFSASFIIIITLLAKGIMFIPIWTYFVALATGALTVIPMGWLYAISNFQVAIGSFNELLFGYMLNASPSHRHPVGPSVYGSIAGDAWYRAQYMLQDQKIGHYMHVSPRAVFFSQIFGSLIGVPINYGVIRWVLNTKGEYISGAKIDPLHQWTGQSLSQSNTLGVQYGLIGPKRLFATPEFYPLPYAFLFGAGCPVVVYLLHRLFPRAKFQLWNTTIFFSGMSAFYGNVSSGYLSKFIGAFVVMYWAYRYKYELWARWNYIMAAAFDTGFNLNLLLIFLCFGVGKIVTMPNWWGNNAVNVERCFALDT